MKACILTIVCSVLVLSTAMFSQNMDKDLEVTENILASVIKNALKEDGFYFPSSFEVSSSYAEDYGVIYSIKAKNLIFGTTISRGGHELSKVYAEIAGRERERVEIESEDEVEVSVVEASKEFLAEYAQLLRDLKSDQRVQIKIGPERSGRFEYFVLGDGQSVYEADPILSTTLSVSKSDIDALKTDKIDKDEFISRIEIKELDADDFKSEDLELMTSILKRLYEKDLSSTYFLAYSPPVYYERVPEVGVTFFMKVYSSNAAGRYYSIPTRGLSKLSYQERNDEVEAMYPEFLSGLKENILEYGRVIKTLEGNDKISVEVDLTECEGCDMPRSVTLSIPFETMEAYGKDQISLEAAMKKFKVTES